MAGGHALLPPSSAHIWAGGGCTGWLKMVQQHPEPEERPEADDGHAGHAIAAGIIAGYAVGRPAPEWPEFDGAVDPHGTPYTREMYDCAVLYADNVREAMMRHGVFAEPYLGVERWHPAGRVHSFAVAGTPDAYLFARSAMRLIVWDYKFGHDYVEVFENWQLICYVAALLDYFDIDGLLDQQLTVEFRVVQPRCYYASGGPVRTWTVKACDLRAHINTAAQRARESLSSDATLRTGEHCKHCPARHACPAALRAGTQLFEAATEPTPHDMDAFGVGHYLSVIKRARAHLESLESALEPVAYQMIRRGEAVPGWIAKPSMGREQWTLDDSAVFELGDSMGVNLRKTYPKTPRQARDAGMDERLVNLYSKRESNGFKLIADDGTTAKKVFNYD